MYTKKSTKKLEDALDSLRKVYKACDQLLPKLNILADCRNKLEDYMKQNVDNRYYNLIYEFYHLGYDHLEREHIDDKGNFHRFHFGYMNIKGDYRPFLTFEDWLKSFY